MESRVDVFDEGTKCMKEEEFLKAIASFQKCMKMLSENGQGLTSNLFPLCLENLAECHKELDEMEKALNYKKFEKLYYETVLLNQKNDKGGLNFKTDEETRSDGDGESKDIADSVTRADEYEQLSQLCLQNKCISLALEYIGKATIIRRHHYGDDHPETKCSFETFTTIYAEAGKEQYTESVKKAHNAVAKVDGGNTEEVEVISPDKVEETLMRHRKRTMQHDEESENKNDSSLVRKRSILKKSPSESQTGDSARHVTFKEPLPEMARLREPNDHDNSCTAWLLFLLLCVMVVLLSVLISAVICNYRPHTQMCLKFQQDIKYYYRSLASFYRNYW